MNQKEYELIGGVFCDSWLDFTIATNHRQLVIQ